MLIGKSSSRMRRRQKSKRPFFALLAGVAAAATTAISTKAFIIPSNNKDASSHKQHGRSHRQSHVLYMGSGGSKGRGKKGSSDLQQVSYCWHP